MEIYSIEIITNKTRMYDNITAPYTTVENLYVNGGRMHMLYCLVTFKYNYLLLKQ